MEFMIYTINYNHLLLVLPSHLGGWSMFGFPSWGSMKKAATVSSFFAAEWIQFPIYMG